MAESGELRFIPQFIIVAALVLGLAPLLAFAVSQGGIPTFNETVWTILWFTLKQAALSTILSVIPALFIARALWRHHFLGRDFLLNLFALPMAMPAIVVVLGVTGLIGNAGLLPALISPYGLGGIMLVHVFFNLPMAVRLFYQALQATPDEAYRLAAQLGFSEFVTFKQVEWPQMKVVLPQISAVIFLICAASFVVVLTLGGPGTTTLEVAIFQSLRMDFDPPRALALSVLQMALCTVLIGFAHKAFGHDVGFMSMRRHGWNFMPQSLATKVAHLAVIALSAFLILPVVCILVWRGIMGWHLDRATFSALATSLCIGITSATGALFLAWPLAKAQDSWSKLLALSGLIVPPAVLATGWFLLARKLNDSTALTFVFITALNILMALPYAVAALRAAHAKLAPLAQLQSQLGISGVNALRLIEWPMLKSSFAQAFLLAMVLSLGDLTAITLMGSNGLVTLPTLLHAEMGHYRGAAAEGTALILLIICAISTLLAQRFGRYNAET